MQTILKAIEIEVNNKNKLIIDINADERDLNKYFKRTNIAERVKGAVDYNWEINYNNTKISILYFKYQHSIKGKHDTLRIIFNKHIYKNNLYFVIEDTTGSTLRIDYETFILVYNTLNERKVPHNPKEKFYNIEIMNNLKFIRIEEFINSTETSVYIDIDK